jgi:uroporphyrinogen-III synthase
MGGLQVMLAGRRVLVTRPREQAGPLVERLRALGAEPIVCPAIRIEPLADAEGIRPVIERLASFDWLVFTSGRAVEQFTAHLHALGRSPGDFPGLRVASIGPATTHVLERLGWPVSLQPAEAVAEALLDALGDVRDQRVLLPTASATREVLPQGLQERGALVEVLPLYRTVPGEGIDEAIALLARQAVDAVTFTSGSTVSHLFEGMQRAGIAPDAAGHLLERARVVCIGPATAEVAQRLGIRVDAIAAEHTIEGIVACLAQLFQFEEVSR